MSITAKVGNRTYEFATGRDFDRATEVWEMSCWSDQEAFENELTGLGVDWTYDLEAFQDEHADVIAAENETSAHYNYIEGQFDRLIDSEAYPLRLQVRDNEGNQTNWLNLNWGQLIMIKQILRDMG